MISNFVERVGPILSKDSRAHLDEQSKSWSMSFAPSREEALVGLKATLKAVIQSINDQLKFKPESIRGLDLSMVLEKETQSALEGVCSGLGGMISDSASQAKKSIYVSAPVATLWPRANSIVQHEFAHLMRGAFKESGLSKSTQETLKEVDKCLGQQHPEFSQAGQKFNVERYGHEDQADFFGMIAEGKDLAGFACLGLRAQIEAGTKMSLRNEDPTDEHSSYFYRALQRHHFKHGSIPQTCLNYLKDAGEEPAFKDCRPKTTK